MKKYKALLLATGLQLLAGNTLFAHIPMTANTFCAALQTIGNQKTRTIASVEEINITCPVGTAPRLPYQVWVTYSDDKGEYRQVKWTNAALATEQAQANSELHPVGLRYSVEGFILGDNTTDEGYPITAYVTVGKKNYPTPQQPIARPLPLTDVTLEGDNRLTSNRDLAIREIISWDVSQQLYNYRDTYGLPTEGYTRSNGWDSPDTKLKGHGSGHYMSALALAYAAATDPAQKKILSDNITRMVNELRACQERTFVWNDSLGRYWEARDFAPEAELRQMKGTWAAFDQHKQKYATYGYGYLNAIPAHHCVLIEMYRAYNNSDWVWAPYYSVHKQLAGLIDIATYYDNKEIADKALLIAKDMGLWVWNRMHHRTFVESNGTQNERRNRPGNRYEMWNMYIAGEVGGIGESLARLSEMVSDPQEKARLIEASNCFDSPAFFQPLSKNIDDIRTRHANQHIPMIIAALRSYLTNKDSYYYNLAENFWSLIQGRYRYATGGVGNGEMFRQPYTQMLSMAMNGVSEGNSQANPTLNETCCAYNLLKLTKDLNCYNPDDARYMDYYERTLYNQLIGSLHPSHYQTTYHYAVGLDADKPWGNRTPQESCCGGTGSENHVKYQEAAYFVSDHTLWVGLYLPTTFQWKEKGITLQQECLWPAESSTIKVKEGSGEFTLKLRVPYWATEGFDVKLNGKSIAKEYKPCSYIAIAPRLWKAGDVVEIKMPFSKHIDYGADKLSAEVASKGTGKQLEAAWLGVLMYGPLAMTATGVSNWDEATLNIDSRLATITAATPTGARTGTEGNLYTLTSGGKEFQPDYYRHNHTTHYFRIHEVADPTAELKQMLSVKLNEAAAYAPTNYSKKSSKLLSAAIRNGKRLIAATDADEKALTDGTAAIDEAIRALVATKLDKSRLQNTITQAENVDADRYTAASLEVMHVVLRRTNEVLENETQQTIVDRQMYLLQEAIAALVSAESVNKHTLEELLGVALERKAAQEKWNAMEVKVPEYAPWAAYGFDRLLSTLKHAQKVYNNEGYIHSQNEVNSAAASLNSAINTMRPGNLPEMEDLRPLSALLRRIGKVTPSTSSEKRAAIEYAQMVMKYVADGSGTHDMIQTAIARLKKFL